MFLNWLLIIITIFGYLNLNKVTSNNNLPKYTVREYLEHKCLKEVPTIYLEYDRKYTNITEGTTNKYYSKIEVCCNGFKRYKYDWDKCIPNCSDCDHGICDEPGYCQCFPNYIKNNDGICVITCPVRCDNGRCTSDGTCRCNSGYELDQTQKFCRPICNQNNTCERSYHQYCSAPNTCSCIEGYHLNRNGCEPVCKHNCGINGTCDRPNQCLCQNGATLKHGICQAECYQKCENGLCIAPNICNCFEGYEYDEQTTTCIIPKKDLSRNFNIEDIL